MLNIPRFIRRFRQMMSVQEVINGNKVIVTRSLTDPGGIRRATDRFGRPDKRLDALRFRILDPTDIQRGMAHRKSLTESENDASMVEQSPTTE